MISVCIATHNGEKYIKEQLESILCQLAPDDEVVISDDGSTDNTLNIIKGYDDSRIKIYHFSQPIRTSHIHVYTAHNFEHALKKASGEYIFLCDQDDIWHPDKVAKCIEQLKYYDMVVHNLHLMDSLGVSMGKNLFEGNFRKQNLLMCGTIYYGCSMAFKRSYVTHVLPFPKYLLLHDYWIGAIIQLTGTMTYIDEPLMDYRWREDSVSHAPHNSIWFKILYRIYTLFWLLIRIIRIKTYGTA